MKKIAFFIMGSLAACCVYADSARLQLENFAHGLDGLSGVFTQQVYDANQQPQQSTRGNLALKAPRQFRWETTHPYQQLIVADSNHVWIYDTDLEQVTVRNQSVEEAHSPLTVLTDLAQLDREFSAVEQGEREELSWLRLQSKAKEPEFEYADLGFDTQGLKRMVFKDTLGNKTEIHFADWHRNPKLASSTFKFTPPKGVDVIGDVKPDAEIYPLKE